MPRQRTHSSNAEKQAAYRQRQALKRNKLKFISVTESALLFMDALTFLRSIPSESVDLVITSPPYNIRKTTGGFFRTTDASSKWKNTPLRKGYDGYSDNLPRGDYIKWQKGCLVEMLRIIRPDGAIFYNHKPRVQSGLIETPNDIVGSFPVRQIIIWDRGCAFNFNDGYFAPSYEFIYLIAKPEFKLRPGASGNRDVWQIGPERNNSHPAPFPLEIPYRILESTIGNIVVDPFVGSGTTAVAAKMLGKTYLCADKSQQYIDEAIIRVQNAPSTYQQHLFSNLA